MKDVSSLQKSLSMAILLVILAVHVGMAQEVRQIDRPVSLPGIVTVAPQEPLDMPLPIGDFACLRQCIQQNQLCLAKARQQFVSCFSFCSRYPGEYRGECSAQCQQDFEIAQYLCSVDFEVCVIDCNQL